jgi:hypothetical protein
VAVWDVDTDVRVEDVVPLCPWDSEEMCDDIDIEFIPAIISSSNPFDRVNRRLVGAAVVVALARAWSFGISSFAQATTIQTNTYELIPPVNVVPSLRIAKNIFRTMTRLSITLRSSSLASSCTHFRTAFVARSPCPSDTVKSISRPVTASVIRRSGTEAVSTESILLANPDLRMSFWRWDRGRGEKAMTMSISEVGKKSPVTHEPTGRTVVVAPVIFLTSAVKRLIRSFRRAISTLVALIYSI